MPSSQQPVSQNRVRAAIRLFLLVMAVLLLVPLCALLLGVAGLRGSVARYRLVMFLTPIVCGTFATIIGLRIRVVGHRHGDVVIFAGNHVTYLDILVGAVGVAGVFVSRHDVKDWPVIGLFARLAGTVFLDRSSLRSAIASSAGIVERSRQGIRIALFPEGRTTAGEGVSEFKPFLFGAVAEAGLAVQPFTIRYNHIGDIPLTRENHLLVNWYDPAPSFTSHGWRLLTLRNVRATIEFHEPLVPSASDKASVRAFVEELHRRVASGLQSQ